MKIRILGHYEHDVGADILRSYNVAISDVTHAQSISYAVIDACPADVVLLLKSFTFTHLIKEIGANKLLYAFDHSGLNTFLSENKDLDNRYNILNRLRLKIAALSYHFPESQRMYSLDLRRPRIMAVLNVTPDSFSDGGRFYSLKDALTHAHTCIEEGADILDIGGESSRPGARPVNVEEEIARVIPVIEALRRATDTLISVDTYKAQVARAALDVGANWINDITGLRGDPDMVAEAAAWKCPVVVMHMQGTPQTMQQNPHYEDVVGEVLDFFDYHLEDLKEQGVTKLIVDPGIGFGKRFQDNVDLIKHTRLLRQFGYPVLLGTSRKSFIGQITGKDVLHREAGTLASVIIALQNGANIVRTHDVNVVNDAIKVFEALM